MRTSPERRLAGRDFLFPTSSRHKCDIRKFCGFKDSPQTRPAGRDQHPAGLNRPKE